MSIKFNSELKGFNTYVKNVNNYNYKSRLDSLGNELVAALISATPIDSGITASSWSYEIIDETHLEIHNDSSNSGINIVELLYYGHGTGNGGYVSPNRFVTEIADPIIAKFEKEIEVVYKNGR